MNFSLQGAPYNEHDNSNTIDKDDSSIERRKQQRKNKTLKRPVEQMTDYERPVNNGRISANNGLPVNAQQENNSINVKNMIDSVHSNDDDGSGLADFYPPPHAELTKRGDIRKNEKLDEQELAPIKNYKVTSIDKGGETDGPVHIEAFNNLPSNDNIPYMYANAYTDAKMYGPAHSYTGPNNYVGPFNKTIPKFTQMSQSNGNKDPLLEKLNYMIHLLEEQQDEKTGHVVEELILYSFLGIFIIFIVDSFARAGKYTR